MVAGSSSETSSGGTEMPEVNMNTSVGLQNFTGISDLTRQSENAKKENNYVKINEETSGFKVQVDKGKGQPVGLTEEQLKQEGGEGLEQL